MKKRIQTGSDNQINRVMGSKEWFLIMLLSIIWGGSFFFIEIAIREMTPLTIVMCRVSFAAIILLFFLQLTGRKLPSTLEIWGSLLIMGAINNLIPFSLIVWGQKYIDSSLASIINATTPIFCVVLAHFLTKDEQMTKNRILGIIIGWFGVVVLIGIETMKGLGVHILAQIAILGAAFLYACGTIFGRRFREIDTVVVATGTLCCSAIMIIPIALIIECPWNLSPGLLTWAALLGLSVLSTSVAYLIYFKVLSTAGATNILLVTFLIPISAILLGVLVLGESPHWNAYFGMGLIFLGLIFIDGRLFNRAR